MLNKTIMALTVLGCVTFSCHTMASQANELQLSHFANGVHMACQSNSPRCEQTVSKLLTEYHNRVIAIENFNPKISHQEINNLVRKTFSASELALMEDFYITSMQAAS